MFETYKIKNYSEIVYDNFDNMLSDVHHLLENNPSIQIIEVQRFVDHKYKSTFYYSHWNLS